MDDPRPLVKLSILLEVEIASRSTEDEIVEDLLEKLNKTVKEDGNGILVTMPGRFTGNVRIGVAIGHGIYVAGDTPVEKPKDVKGLMGVLAEATKVIKAERRKRKK